MNYSIISVQAVQRFFAVLAILAMVFGPFANVQLAQADHDPFGGAPQTSVEICHSGNGKNFVKNSPSITATGGNINLAGHEAHDNDIIPPFHFDDNGTLISYEGKNWPAGEDIWENDCIDPEADHGTITVNKVVIGGDAEADDFTLLVGDIEVESGEANLFFSSQSGSGEEYVISETGGPDDYELTAIQCVKDTEPAVLGDLEDGEVTIGLKKNQEYICTLTNTYVDPGQSTGTLTVTKVVINDDAGTKLVSDFPLFIDGNPVTSGVSNLLAPATYTVTEIADVNYVATFSGDCDENGLVTLAEGENKTCTITNDDVDIFPGCTDRSALNWDDEATVNDGSCVYMCIYSDTATVGNGVDSVLTFVHPAWTQELSESLGEWIWSADSAQTATFTKQFVVNSAPVGASLTIGADNSYTVSLNGTPLSCDGTGTGNYVPNAGDTCSAPVVEGVNTLTVVAENFGGPNSADLVNPAGLIFELTVEGSNCSPMEENPGSITIVKEFAGEVEPADWSFEFTGDLGQGGFTLSDETPSRTFENLGEEEYLINEIIPTGWAAPVVECTDGSGAGQGEDQLVVVLGEGEDVTCTFTNRELPPEPAQCISEANLLSNGSFENPTVTANGGQWENFAAVTGWTLLADGLELWNGLFGGANDGSQNAELDGNAAAATAISQVVATVVGNDYKLTYDFAARPNTNLANNELDVVIDGIVVDTVSADGTGDGSIDWGTYTYEFTAATTSTLVEFRDAGTDDGYGTLLDGAELCLTEDNSDGGEPQTGVLQIIKIINGSEVNASNFSFDVDKTGTDVGDLVDVAFETDGSNAYDYTTGVFTVTENAAEGYTTTYSNSMDADANCELLLVTPNATTTCTITNTFDEDGGNGEDDTYRVFGQVWHDENENDERDFFEDESSEDILEGWLITITDNDEFIATTTSDEYGNYEFEVPAGEYVITQTMQEGWALTFPNDGYWEVCVPIACEAEVTFFESILNAVIPTAYAAVAANNGPLNFGNVRTTPNYSQGSYGGGNGNGRNISLRDDDDDDDTDEPEGQVLGEATSTMPVGAPNTGAGGASALSFSLHGVVAILASRKGVQVSNGK